MMRQLETTLLSRIGLAAILGGAAFFLIGGLLGDAIGLLDSAPLLAGVATFLADTVLTVAFLGAAIIAFYLGASFGRRRRWL